MSLALADTPPESAVGDWQRAQREAFTRPGDLLSYLQLDPALPALDLARLRDFPLRVPRGYAARMRQGDPHDPLFLQVWPRIEEGHATAGFGLDAVGDLAAQRGDGLIHKYRGRALLITTGACAVHCRYCFRRHFPYADGHAARGRWQPVLARIAGDTSLHEVILSGGDPLSLGNAALRDLLQGLDAIPHLRTVRLHTRQPVVLPERIDNGLLELLSGLRLRRVVVLHANHANELDHTVARACEGLRRTGATLLNQSVLLNGINDVTDVLFALHDRLFSLGVLPYYLHLVDRVDGAAHFEVPEDRARQLMQELSACSPGYLVPRLAREVPGGDAKQWIQW